MRRTIGFLLIAAIIADRAVKIMALNGVHGTWWIAHFELFKNDRLVFSLPLSNLVAMSLMVVAMGLVLWLGWRAAQKHDVVVLTGYYLILLGALSNLFDRLRFGFVVDWAYFGPWWPVFNLADLMIAGGVVVVLLANRDQKNSAQA